VDSQFPLVTLVVGPEELLAERATAAVVAAVAGDAPTPVEVHRLTAADMVPGALVSLVSPSLFEERKVVVLSDVQDAREELVTELRSYLRAPAPEVALVLLHRGGARGKGLLDAARKAGAAEVSAPGRKSRREKLEFLRAEVQAARRRATDEALETLLDAVGGDLRSLAGAASQLAADTEGVLDGDVVRRYYAGRAEVSGFAVADRAIEGRTAAALTELRWALQSGTDPVPIVAALAIGLRNVVKVASAPRGLRGAELARATGLPPWKVDIVRRQARAWSEEGAAGAFLAVAAADAAVKGAGADPVYALETAVRAIGRARRSGG
jgi:DNA polymerase-3 subunit delta